MPPKSHKKLRGRVKEKMLVTSRLMAIRLIIDDYIYKNKPISLIEAIELDKEITSLKFKCLQDTRSLQVVEKLKILLKSIIKEQSIDKQDNLSCFVIEARVDNNFLANSFSNKDNSMIVSNVSEVENDINNILDANTTIQFLSNSESHDTETNNITLEINQQKKDILNSEKSTKTSNIKQVEFNKLIPPIKTISILNNDLAESININEQAKQDVIATNLQKQQEQEKTCLIQDIQNPNLKQVKSNILILPYNSCLKLNNDLAESININEQVKQVVMRTINLQKQQEQEKTCLIQDIQNPNLKQVKSNILILPNNSCLKLNNDLAELININEQAKQDVIATNLQKQQEQEKTCLIQDIQNPNLKQVKSNILILPNNSCLKLNNDLAESININEQVKQDVMRTINLQKQQEQEKTCLIQDIQNPNLKQVKSNILILPYNSCLKLNNDLAESININEQAKQDVIATNLQKQQEQEKTCLIQDIQNPNLKQVKSNILILPNNSCLKLNNDLDNDLAKPTNEDEPEEHVIPTTNLHKQEPEKTNLIRDIEKPHKLNKTKNNENQTKANKKTNNKNKKATKNNIKAKTSKSNKELENKVKVNKKSKRKEKRQFDFSWVENMKYIREVSPDEHLNLQIEDSFWSNLIPPGTWNSNDFDI